MSRIGRLGSVVTRSPKIAIGAGMVLFFVLLVLVGPIFITTDPSATSDASLEPPSGGHWLGTTQTGEDVFAQLVYGGRVSLAVGVLAAVFATIVSATVGLVGGYLRGKVDGLLSLLTSVFLVIPAMPLLIVLAGYLPTKGIESVAIVISITAWAWGARTIRAQTLSIRNRDFVVAARASGESTTRIIFCEILPNQVPLLASSFLFTIVVGILSEAGLSFLGLGSLTTVSWGSMLYFAQSAQALLTGAWWWFLPPGLCIALLGMGLALINFGLDEYANPRLRTVRRPKGRPTPIDVGEPATKTSTVESVDPVGGEPILEVKGLSVDYPTEGETVSAVKDVSITLHKGEMLGLAGESGSGKSTLTNAVARLLRPPAEVKSGEALFYGRGSTGGVPIDILRLTDEELARFRWADLSIVFQSAMNALNPVISVGAQFYDVLRRHRPELTRQQQREVGADLLERVSISPDRLTSFPHELSGGMKQRVAIAMALALDPQIIIMDEPTTALDVLVQRQILQQILELREQYGFAVIFTTHDLSLLLEICDTIAIMRRGELVEYGQAKELHHNPQHEYTKDLLGALRDLGVAV